MTLETIYKIGPPTYANYTLPIMFSVGFLVATVSLIARGTWHDFGRFGLQANQLIAVYGFAALSFFGATSSFLAIYISYRNMIDIYEARQYKTTEGFISDVISPDASAGRDGESFVVNSRKFSYYYYSMSPGYNLPRSRGGLIREGLFVRIDYYDGVILRLQIGRDI